MRLFTAIPVSESVRVHLAHLIERLSACDADVKWVEPENLHLTIKFIGDVGDPIADEVKALCGVVALETVPFPLSVRGVRTFPRGKPAIKTIFAAVDEGVEAWKTVARSMEPTLLDLGVPRENGLVPHITLGRVRGDKNMPDLRAAIEREEDVEYGTQTADRIELIQSFLDPRGAQHKTIAAWPFVKKT